MNNSPTLTVRFSIPPKSLWPNARDNWRKRSAEKRAYRDSCVLIVRERLEGRDLRLKRCRIVSSWVFRTNRRRDADNLIGALKSAFDALKLAGAIADDDLTRVEHGHPHVLVVPDSMSEYVVLNIFEVHDE